MLLDFVAFSGKRQFCTTNVGADAFDRIAGYAASPPAISPRTKSPSRDRIIGFRPCLLTGCKHKASRAEAWRHRLLQNSDTMLLVR
jgi:hypothetical protein